ncbi:O-succinylbenzoate--CoA ligase [Candidatus Vecturithrix granuli]|uniref:O-succinylbenzoate--CoA ligase n=1 Tax=Vecturithrix granuli TaxID=1499967 RepID=A0A081C5V8_VECG1|nr:O-succinylbenzoate--CoA ligase [Candidatus Vecturithrix granuli]
MTLGEMLERSATKYPNKTAIVFRDRRVNYKDLNAEANKLGRALNALGVGQNDKVGVLMNNCPEFVTGVFAALKAGAAFVAFNSLLSGRELTYVINNSDAKVIVTAPPYDELLLMLRPQLPQVQYIITLDDDPEDENLLPFSTLIAPYEDSNLTPAVKLSDMAAIYYSSGTTGLPRGAMLSHVNILSSTVAIGKAVEASRKDVPLNCLPMFHTLAMTACMMVPIFAGMTNVLLENFLPQPVLKGFSDWKVTIFVGVPTMFAVLANMPNLERYDVSHLRLGYCGGAPLTTAIAEKFESRFPCKIYEGYGLSECSPLVSVNPLSNRKIGSIGKAADRVKWKVVDMNNKEVPRNTVGEIVVQGPNVMMGYYKDEEANKEAFRGGWFHTGDLGYMDEDDFVFIADRKKDMIIVGGENVYPKEIENVLTQHPAVQDAGVIGMEDAIRGEVPKAYIVPKLGASIDEKDILSYCRKYLAAYKVPRSIEVIDEIPKNVTGKILKRVLRRIAAGLPAEEEEEFEDEGEEGDELAVDESELETLEEVVEEPSIVAPPAGGMSLEEQMRQLESGGGTPPVSGMSLEDQMRLLEGSGGAPSAAGMSLEDQMHLLEGGGGTSPAAGVSLEAQMRQFEGGGGKVSVEPPVVRPPKVVPSETGGAGGFDDRLRELVMEIPGGIAGSIAGIDGIGITSFTTDPDFPTVLADAELAAVTGAFSKAAKSLDAGSPLEAYFIADKYGFVVKLIRDQYLVTLIVEAKELNWGLVRLNFNKVIPQIEAELF